MADLTKELVIGTAWTEVRTALGIEDGRDYTFDVAKASSPIATVYWAVTDDANEPSAALTTGHPIRPTDTRVAKGFTSEQRFWLRTDRGTAVLVATVE